ncbi:diadenylate cyclase CdaA [Desulfobulbus rhabdoformis]|uniref:diadenylate cyclase CdaA n=1 Tax=Desulfobulbus rhabdoformis TaxID=34032 RepID=UPI0019662688|nr:diadenylate cyclase CdaA [Desulfobulbus rhabdoformis]MBM9614153.1 diadenylate cyclase CdaA [Desulfobulbus rhabdoformis]
MLDALQSMRMLDIFDILIVSFIIYRIMLLIRGTRAVQMLVGIALIIIIYYLSGKFELQTLHWLLKTFLGSILVVIVILFQTDIRRALTQMGRSPFHAPGKVGDREVEELIRAATFMARRRIGALLVIERDNGLRDYLDSGHRLDALLKAELLMAIFLPASPMHDGAVIISKGKIHSAGCLLPLSRNPAINKRYGTRHRAALGLSEETDAVIIVVSEETQEISLVQEGEITSFHDEKDLTQTLSSLCTHPMKQPLLARILSKRSQLHA